jgi:hypothetical protein
VVFIDKAGRRPLLFFPMAGLAASLFLFMTSEILIFC